jgi:hypothetical protein
MTPQEFDRLKGQFIENEYLARTTKFTKFKVGDRHIGEFFDDDCESMGYFETFWFTCYKGDEPMHNTGVSQTILEEEV